MRLLHLRAALRAAGTSRRSSLRCSGSRGRTSFSLPALVCAVNLCLSGPLPHLELPGAGLGSGCHGTPLIPGQTYSGWTTRRMIIRVIYGQPKLQK